MMASGLPMLVADIGGTNARFALAMVGERIELSHVTILSGKDYDSLQVAASAFLGEISTARPRKAVIAVAGPVVGGRVKMTNCPWSFSQSTLAAEMGMDEVAVLNDFEAIACALPCLDPDALLQIGSGDRAPAGTRVVLGPGTGIGVAALVSVGPNWKVLASEGGHVGFAPADALERELLECINSHYPRVSVERLISGRGVTTLYQALGMIRGENPEALSPEEITRIALREPDSLCARALDVFCGILGSFAGDMAVTFNATGGVYLAGGILPKIQKFFLRSRFRERFEDKGRLEYVRRIPTHQILSPQPALIGAAAWSRGIYL